MRSLLVLTAAAFAFGSVAHADPAAPAPAAPAAETPAAPAAVPAAPEAPAAPVDCTTLEGDAKTECEAAAAAAAAPPVAPEPAKGGKAKRSNTNRMEAEFTDEE